MGFSPGACWDHTGSFKNIPCAQMESTLGVSGAGGKGVVIERQPQGL